MVNKQVLLESLNVSCHLDDLTEMKYNIKVGTQSDVN
jgi:hypothetical protein